MPQKHRVRNWKSYNNALKRRGDLFFYFDENFFKHEWHFRGKQKAGGETVYSDAAIEMFLSIKYNFGLALRQTQGLIESILRKLGLAVSVPDYSTVCRRSKTLSIKIKTYGCQNSKEPLHLLLDSTGLSIYSGSYLHTNRHMKHRLNKMGKSWKKLHISFDVASAQVMSSELSDSHIQDAAKVEKLTNLAGRKIASICADKAYDKRICYQRAQMLGAEVIIPPIKVARLQREMRPKQVEQALKPRDQAISFIRQYPTYEEGVKAWKKSIGYHQRSRIEGINMRFKQTFGYCLSSKLEETRIVETIIKLSILNKQTMAGTAKYERIS